MQIAILSGGTGWHVQDLLRAAAALGHHATAFDFRQLSATVAMGRSSFLESDAFIVRTMPAGSLEQVVFRMDLLHEIQSRGKLVVNPPRAVEVCVDKYLTSARLESAGIRTPPTAVCQTANDAQNTFVELGGDVVVKPLFGAEGRGMVRVSDPELAWRTFRAIEQTGGVIYLQQFIQHPGWDVRAFVIGGQVIGAMRRTAHGDWRTNVSQGGTGTPMELSIAQDALARNAASAVGAVIAGVDLLPGPNGEWYVIEVNAVPGWRALGVACGLDVAKLVVSYLAQEYQT